MKTVKQNCNLISNLGHIDVRFAYVHLLSALLHLFGSLTERKKILGFDLIDNSFELMVIYIL